MKFTDLNLLSVGHTIGLVGAIYQGEVAPGDERTILCFFPGESKSGIYDAMQMDRGEWEKFLRQADLHETEIVAKNADGTLAKAIFRKCQRQIDQVVTWRVFRRDGYRCRYCGNDDVPLTVDHVIVWEEGGPSTEQNLVAACKRCNKVRGNTPFEAWLRHPRYLEQSKKLDEETRRKNAALVETLSTIKLVYVRSR